MVGKDLVDGENIETMNLWYSRCREVPLGRLVVSFRRRSHGLVVGAMSCFWEASESSHG
jgi:hypothetical protein